MTGKPESRKVTVLGKRSKQRGLFEADTMHIEFVGRGSFYGYLASQRGRLFRNEDSADLYCHTNGRSSVPPSLLATPLVLRAHDRVSDAEAKDRSDYDLRWKVALGIAVNERPFAKSTLQLFRAQLIVHDRAQQIFCRSIEKAKQSGFLHRRKKLHAAVDTMVILGRGAVKASCIGERTGPRTITLHPQEAVMQRARRHQQSKAFRRAKRRRQVVEHRIARLRQLGVRQARYMGRAKTLFQLVMAATVANLTLVAGAAAEADSTCRHFCQHMLGCLTNTCSRNGRWEMAPLLRATHHSLVAA